MKIAELVTGLRYMMTNEQRELFNMVKEQKNLPRHSLNERQQEVLEQMSRSGLVDRTYDEESQIVSYKLFQR
jgi:hypothetical protein